MLRRESRCAVRMEVRARRRRRADDVSRSTVDGDGWMEPRLDPVLDLYRDLDGAIGPLLAELTARKETAP